jgi:hypothetical protein
MEYKVTVNIIEIDRLTVTIMPLSMFYTSEIDEYAIIGSPD